MMLLILLYFFIISNKNMQKQQSNKNVCVVVIGMSGTGKTTFVQKMATEYRNVYCMNLDPAVKVIHYQPFLDIRKTHEYKKVMNQFKLGPNGAILTALNLYTAQPEQIIEKVEQVIQQNDEDKVFLVDIPGQIEVFTWSASSLILMESLSLIMPVKIFYIIDSVRCMNPNNFLSNLLFAQSIQYRMKKFQFALFLNKSDASEPDKLMKWMKDYDAFLESLDQNSTYLSTLSKSIVINLSDYYEKLAVQKISAKTGFGFNQLPKYLQVELLKN